MLVIIILILLTPVMLIAKELLKCWWRATEEWREKKMLRRCCQCGRLVRPIKPNTLTFELYWGNEEPIISKPLPLCKRCVRVTEKQKQELRERFEKEKATEFIETEIPKDHKWHEVQESENGTNDDR